MPIELHGIVKLTNPDDEGIFFWTPPIILKLSLWGDKEFKKMTTNCIKTKWDDKWLRMLATYSNEGEEDEAWNEKECDYYIASVTWRTRDKWLYGIEQDLCEGLDCNQPVEFVSPRNYCKQHWLAWWYFLDQEEYLDRLIALEREGSDS